MSDKVRIAVVGAGPGGLSAAARAAELGLSHVLLEQSPAHANTIQRYQKGKHVMAEPNVLPLRSPLPFAAGVREHILGEWGAGLERLGVAMRCGSEVTAITGAQGDFHLTLKDGGEVLAENVVFAIGLQGNPRQLGVPGDDLPCVQYTLDDPDEYRDETIVVVGAGDAAIENALGLARRNKVFIVNRADEFVRVKEGNLSAVLKAIDDGTLGCFYHSQCTSLAATPGQEKPYALTLATAQGETVVPCHRIIARIGAIPPRKFVEACGIRFSGTDAAALPELSPQYESSVPGLYVIGALGGYPLIKQAMNQGWEVVGYIEGHAVEPADEPLLVAKLKNLPTRPSAADHLAYMQQRIPLFSDVNPLMFRELMLGSTVHRLKSGEDYYRKIEISNRSRARVPESGSTRDASTNRTPRPVSFC